MITLREIDRNNYMQCLQLQVAPEQKEFVASNAFSLAQAAYLTEYKPFAIYDNGDMVGFIMYAEYPEEDRHWIMRLMIDQKHQRKGYGRQAMTILIAMLMAKSFGHSIYISHHPDNKAARALYESLGFYPNGETIDEEIVLQLDY